MYKKIWILLVATLVLLALGAAWIYRTPFPTVLVESASELPSVESGKALYPEGAVSVEEELIAILEDPRVQSYFRRQEDKQRLSDYFSGENTEITDEEAWQLIDAIERDGRIMAYEALALKLAWLERNSASKAEFDAEAQSLIEEYRQRSLNSVKEYDPYKDVPGFAEYKEAEKQIVREVEQMNTFPDGMSRQEYLRRRLQEAREKAYGH